MNNKTRNTIHNIVLRMTVMAAVEAVIIGFLLIPDFGQTAGVVEGLGLAYLVLMAAANGGSVIKEEQDEY